MLLQQLVQTSQQVAAAAGRLAKIKLLADLLKQAGPDEVETVICYLSGALPQSKVGVGWAALEGARDSGFGTSGPGLEIRAVDATFEQIAKTSGKGSGTAKKQLLRELFARATADEQDFLFRLVTGQLRQGALEGIMVEALARARELPASDVRRAVMLTGSLGAVAQGDLKSVAIQLFRPIKPMLAKTAEDVGEALAELGPAAFEYKFDGMRVQAHKRGSEVRLYSRLLNDITETMPDVVTAVRRLSPAELILDGEALGLTDDGKPLLFQETMRRNSVRPFFFDILYVDGTSLLDQPYSTRVQVLAEHVPEPQRPPRLVTADRDAAQQFFEAAIASGNEGLMAKGLDTPYAAGRRAGAWVKIKRANTLDLVVLAAEWGHGRRKGWLSNLHLGARDPAAGEFVMLGKTFKGMTDELLEWQTARLQELKVRESGITVFVKPELVVEIACNGLQDSPHYPGGMALRFARVVRYRHDKKPEDADTIETVRKLHGK
jgi:DNA ligase 1